MKTPSVLVVDDEKNIRVTLRESLKPLGFEVDTAINGEEALELAGRESYELILLDLKMPGMDGMEVFRQLRLRSPSSAVVLVTAHGSVDAAVQAMKLGAVDFVQKPFAPQEIRDVVTHVLQRRNPRNDADGKVAGKQ